MKHLLYAIIALTSLSVNAQYTLKSLGLKGHIKKITISRYNTQGKTDSLIGKALFSTTIFFDKNGNYTKRIHENIDQHLDIINGGTKTATPTYKNNQLVAEHIVDSDNNLLEKLTFKYHDKDTITVTRYKADGTVLQTAKKVYKDEQTYNINAKFHQNDSTTTEYSVRFKYNSKNLETHQIFKEQNKNEVSTITEYLEFDTAGNWVKAHEENPFRWSQQLLFQNIEYY